MNVTTELESCPLCFESYGVTGTHIPRYLPCSCHYTLCESCIRVLSEDNTITCPQCTKIYPADPNQIQTFPQNKTIINFLQSTKSESYGLCKDHGSKLENFCRRSGCQRPICGICLIKEHNDHDVVSLSKGLEEKKATLNDMVSASRSKLHDDKEKLANAMKEITEKNKKTLESIDKTEQEFIREMKELRKIVNAQEEIVKGKINDKIQIIDDTVDSLENRRMQVNARVNFDDVTYGIEETERTDKKYKEKMRDASQFVYYGYEPVTTQRILINQKLYKVWDLPEGSTAATDTMEIKEQGSPVSPVKRTGLIGGLSNRISAISLKKRQVVTDDTGLKS